MSDRDDTETLDAEVFEKALRRTQAKHLDQWKEELIRSAHDYIRAPKRSVAKEGEYVDIPHRSREKDYIPNAVCVLCGEKTLLPVGKVTKRKKPTAAICTTCGNLQML